MFEFEIYVLEELLVSGIAPTLEEAADTAAYHLIRCREEEGSGEVYVALKQITYLPDDVVKNLIPAA